MIKKHTAHTRLRLACSMLCLFALQPALAAPQQALVPGGIALLALPDYQPDTQISFDGKRVAVFKQQDAWYAIAGIDLNDSPGEHTFNLSFKDGSNRQHKIMVENKKYDEQHLTIKDKRKVDPSAEDLKRISSERVRKARARRTWTENSPQLDFIWPVRGEISSIFGLRRFFNQQERNPHNGLDIAAPEGLTVIATAAGKVIDSGDFFFSGNMIYLDHGQGIISLYAHLSRIDVKPGDAVKQGDIIGAVGQTGRVTGPHLHFAVYANQTLVDPLFLLPEMNMSGH